MNPLINKTYGELLALNTPEGNKVLLENGLDRSLGYVTVDLMRGKTLTIRKWRMLRRIQALRK